MKTVYTSGGPGAGPNLRAKRSELAAGALILLLVYAALSKLLVFNQFRAQLLVQPIPRLAAELLAYFLPAAELAAVALLARRRTQLAGFRLSLLLLSAFTGYTALALLHFFPHTPCPCGGILGHLGWGAHLGLNLFFLLITTLGIYLSLKEGRSGD